MIGCVVVGDERVRVIEFWKLLELFSPQPLPALPAGNVRGDDDRVVRWSAGQVLPWERLQAPRARGAHPRTWRHEVFLGEYELASTYDRLGAVFGADDEAYEKRPKGHSACAALLVDAAGRLVPGSPVLSSALWAIGRLPAASPVRPGTLDGFDKANTEFAESTDRLIGSIDDDDEPDAPALDGAALLRLLGLAHASAGVTGSDLATNGVRIRSRVVEDREDESEESQLDFLNSFYLEDLDLVLAQVREGEIGQALGSFLTPDADIRKIARTDVLETPQAVSDGVSVSRLPKGRWPSKPEHSLALSQQFAVNQALNELSASADLMGVNGPPGTGKTTMLRDILAGLVTDRARRLAALERTEDAFTATVHRWSDGAGFPRRVRQLRADLTGFEMIVASANNAAVENVSLELPARAAIDRTWQGQADYFSEVASALLPAKARGGVQNATEAQPSPAWGLVSARLGNKGNRAAFKRPFWLAKKRHAGTANETGIDSVQQWLLQCKNREVPVRPWAQAREAFRSAEQKVDDLLARRTAAEERLTRISELSSRVSESAQAVVAAQAHYDDTASQLARHENATSEIRNLVSQLTARYERALAGKPGLLEMVFSLGGAGRRWRTQLAPHLRALEDAEDRHAEAARAEGRCREAQQQAAQRLRTLVNEQHESEHELNLTRAAVQADLESFEHAHPAAPISAQEREKRAPWLDAQLDTARSELFLAAMRLHQDFLANAAAQMLDGLRAAADVVAGDAPFDLKPNAALAAWQTFFLAVPLVSTTFASAGRMLRGLGRESLGWLFIDEAGQAPAQFAVGAMWRARRVIVVGDPLQLEPIVAIPNKARRSLAKGAGVTATWIPPQASVQCLADRVARYGTHLEQSGRRVWVSAPLRVHRRCDDPMFTFFNDLAYNGIMVSGVHRKLSGPATHDAFDSPDGPIITPSHWADEPATTPGTHLQAGEIDRLRHMLDELAGHEIGPEQVIAISPFKDVARRLESLSHEYPGLEAGTIHTAQGREADVVFFVLGGDPRKPGAKAWAAESVNLINVAVSRAKRRLYVIGDRHAWERVPYFGELSSTLSPAAPAAAVTEIEVQRPPEDH